MDHAGNLALLLSLAGLISTALAAGLFLRGPSGRSLDSQGRLTNAGALRAIKWASSILAPVLLFLALFVATFDWGRID